MIVMTTTTTSTRNGMKMNCFDVKMSSREREKREENNENQNEMNGKTKKTTTKNLMGPPFYGKKSIMKIIEAQIENKKKPNIQPNEPYGSHHHNPSGFFYFLYSKIYIPIC